MKKLILVLSAILLTHCQSAQKHEAPPVDMHPQEANLTQAEASERASLISNVKYSLDIQMDGSSETYQATETIEFDRRDLAHDTFLDFRNGGKILKFTLNGKVHTPVYAQHRILLPQTLMVSGANKVEIQFQQNYANNGRGLHRFVDPEDKRVYFYTQFEAFDAHRMFPCFDQPDLKATMKMKVTTPKAWEVITTTRETTKTSAGDNVIWNFPETPRMSSYLFSLHAGPYAKWEAKSGTIPLRLFARKSLQKFVVTKEWFKPTQEGLRFYGQYFAYPYPFKKYDQVIVPEFNAGAMENIAAVTFSERMIQRSASTIKERERLSSVILHEMAHMWFGDLVTMRWWNGLWLNESFATYMSEVAQTRATQFKDSWISFYSKQKTGTYVEDQLVTTHPIEAQIPDTDSAFSNFDGITYGKGASVLKQLAFYIGEDAFRDGVRNYFKDYAYSNTQLMDFIGALEQSSRQDLHPWAKAWLEEAGVDTVEAQYTCNAGKVNKFALKLTGPNGGVSSRPHRALVALYQEKNGKIVPSRQQSVTYKGALTEVSQLVGADCPVMVYPNEQDHDYVKVHLDQRTLAAAKENLSKVTSTFTRVMFWPNLFSMVRDVELTPQEFLKIVIQNMPKETDLTIMDAVLGEARGVVNYLPRGTAEQKTSRARLIGELEDMIWKKIETSKSTDWQKLMLGSYIGLVETQAGRDNLLGLLDGKIKLKGLVIDADRRWGMIIRLSALGDARVEPIFAKQRELDKSNRGVASAFAAEAAKPSLDVKNAWLPKLVEGKVMSFEQKRTVMWNFLPHTQDEIRASLGEQYYSSLPNYAKSLDMELLAAYASTMLPATCSPASAAKLGTFVSQSTAGLPAPVVKTLRVGAQEDARCVAIRAHAASVH